MRKTKLALVWTALFLVPAVFFAGPSASAQEAGRIVNGKPAAENSWPAQALVLTSGGFCGGTLIHPRWVVTAAHCFPDNANPSDTAVALGSVAFQAAPRQAVTAIFTHKGFENRTYDNDIALLRLKEASRQPPRALARPEQRGIWETGTKGFIAGWGTTCFEYCDISRILLQADVTVRPSDLCSLVFEAVGLPLSDNMICAGGGSGTSDACQGDSGGPLEVQGESGRILIGIVSWGIGCGDERFPGVYTNVSRYLNWIGPLTADRVTAPGQRVIRGQTSISIGNQSSLELPASFRAKTKGTFRVTRNGCSFVDHGASCQIAVRDLSSKKTRGRLVIESRAGVRLASITLRG